MENSDHSVADQPVLAHYSPAFSPHVGKCVKSVPCQWQHALKYDILCAGFSQPFACFSNPITLAFEDALSHFRLSFPDQYVELYFI